MAPAVAEAITGVPAADIERTARTLWESRPVAFYAWSGLEQHSNTTQTIRAINQLYALIGDLDAPGGNVLFPACRPTGSTAPSCSPPQQRAKALGVAAASAGPGAVRVRHRRGPLHRGARRPTYRARGLVNFGANLVMAHGDSARGRDALAALDFFVHADLFLNPTAEQADIVLPVASAFETEGLRIGFEVSEAAQSLVQLRRPLVPPRGEARSDLQIIFALATRLGLGEHFWHGDIDAAWRHQLAPSGVTLEQLRAEPAGVRVPLRTRHRKYAELEATACRAGSRPSSRKIELYSEELAEHGYPPLPEFEEPRTSPRSRPDLAERFPLVLTCAKSLWFCETQHRNLPSLRRRAPDPPVELHPEHRPGPRHRRGRLGPHRHAARQRPRPRPAQRQPRSRRSSAASTAGGRRAAELGLRRLSAVRPGQRQPEPGAAPAAQRSDQRELAAARVGLRGPSRSPKRRSRSASRSVGDRGGSW